MIKIKTEEEISLMRQGGKILSEVLWEVLAAAKPGISEMALDALAEKRIREKGGEPGFQKVPGYKHTICVSTNDVVVHGIPTEYRLQEGDVFGVDCGVFYKGFHTDMAHTIVVGGKKSSEVDVFLKTGEKALTAGIAEAKGGNRVGHISKAIQDIVENQGGYSIVRTLVGHGVGKNLHEEPEIPGFLSRDIKKTPQLTVGMTIAVEIIYNIGGKEIMYKNDDGWTISTADEKISGLFERTIAITERNPIVLTS